MQVTLKKAAELSRAALAAAKAIEPKSTVTISAYSTTEVEAVVEEGRSAFNAALARSLALVNAGFEIRALIGNINAAVGVDALLTKVASIDETIARITAASGVTADKYSGETGTDSDDMEALKRRVEQSRRDITDAENRRYGSRDEIKIVVLGTAQKQELVDEIGKLKRLRAAHKDELTAINFGTKIDLPGSVVDTLRAEKLID